MVAPSFLHAAHTYMDILHKFVTGLPEKPNNISPLKFSHFTCVVYSLRMHSFEKGTD